MGTLAAEESVHLFYVRNGIKAGEPRRLHSDTTNLEKEALGMYCTPPPPLQERGGVESYRSERHVRSDVRECKGRRLTAS